MSPNVNVNVNVNVADMPQIRAVIEEAAAALHHRNAVILAMAADLHRMNAAGAIDVEQWPAAQALLAACDDIPRVV